MPIDASTIGGLGLVGYTIERIPDDVEILAPAGEVQRGRVLQADKQRTTGYLLRHAPTDDRQLERFRVLAK
jgi:hypothetical protein